jgi:pyrroloquinoline quinone (PQQ) biosynthesis protein C
MGSHLPFTPDDIAAPALAGPEFIASLKEQRRVRYPEPPPFYQALYDGQLSREDLTRWVKDLYYYWDHGVVYSTGAIFVKTNDEPTRTHILRRMVDIEGEELVDEFTHTKTPAWEELWLRLGLGLGLSRREIQEWRPITRTHFAVTTLCTFSRYWDWTWLDGIATFYAADLHGHEHLARAGDALRLHYRLPAGPLEFFRVYSDDIATHIPWEEEALAYWCSSTERQLSAARAFRERLDIEYQLLYGVEKARVDGTVEFQTP